MPTFGQRHSALQRTAQIVRLGNDVPAMLVRPEEAEGPLPLLIWMHGRTADKELDSGRYLRLMRNGIASCSLDLPGHGERLDEALHEPAAVLPVIEQMVEELDDIVAHLRTLGDFDPDRIAIGGISAGGMAALIRCCRDHPFSALTVEATTGNLQDRASAIFANQERLERLDPITHLANWREVPVLAVHNQLDEWIDVTGQRTFIDTLRKRYADPNNVVFHVYEEPTGAPFEHAGFGRFSADSKIRQLTFLQNAFGIHT